MLLKIGSSQTGGTNPKQNVESEDEVLEATAHFTGVPSRVFPDRLLDGDLEAVGRRPVGLSTHGLRADVRAPSHITLSRCDVAWRADVLQGKQRNAH